MAITINTNSAASAASFQLTKNNAALQKSLNRLSSGNRITQPSDDAGGLAVSMKLKGSINRLRGVEYHSCKCKMESLNLRVKLLIGWQNSKL